MAWEGHVQHPDLMGGSMPEGPALEQHVYVWVAAVARSWMVMGGALSLPHPTPIQRQVTQALPHPPTTLSPSRRLPSFPHAALSRATPTTAATKKRVRRRTPDEMARGRPAPTRRRPHPSLVGAHRPSGPRQQQPR
jgi:hypothetical protein